MTYWRDLPSLVVARDGDDVTKAPLAQRFQEAIDEAAMRLGAVDSDAYLDGWRRSDWTPDDGTTDRGRRPLGRRPRSRVERRRRHLLPRQPRALDQRASSDEHVDRAAGRS